MGVLEAEGVNFHLGAAVTGVRDLGNEREVAVKAADGSTLKLKADTILVATGRAANVSGLGLESIGVEFDRRGVKVDERLRTTQKHIYAAGDVTGKYQFTHAAGYEGSVVIANAIFHLPRKTDYTLLPWCTYTDPELASIGMNETAAKQAGIKYSVWTEEFRDNDRSLAEGEHTGRIKMILGEDEKPIGVQIFGPHAGELISEWVSGDERWRQALDTRVRRAPLPHPRRDKQKGGRVASLPEAFQRQGTEGASVLLPPEGQGMRRAGKTITGLLFLIRSYLPRLSSPHRLAGSCSARSSKAWPTGSRSISRR